MCSNNNRRFNNNNSNNYNQRDNYNQRGGSDYYNNHSNYNNNNNNNSRYQNGDSGERGGSNNWNNRGNNNSGGSRTFNRSQGADSRFPPLSQQQQPQQQAQQPPQQQQQAQNNQQIQDEPVNTRWQEPPQQQDDRFGRSNNSFGGKWNQRGGEIDYTVPLPRDERVEQELFGTANTGINFSKYEDIPVEATGHQVPEHITSFDDIKLTEIIRSNIKMARYDKPTPVQKYAIPIIISGRDLMSCAQTGSG